MASRSLSIGILWSLAFFVPCVIAAFLIIDGFWLLLYGPKYEEWRRQNDHVRAQRFLASALEKDVGVAEIEQFRERATLLLPGVRVVVVHPESGQTLFDSRPGSLVQGRQKWEEARGHLPILLSSGTELRLFYPADRSIVEAAWRDLLALMSNARVSSEVRMARIEMTKMLAVVAGMSGAIAIFLLARSSHARRLLRAELEIGTRSVVQLRSRLRQSEREFDRRTEDFVAKLVETDAYVGALTIKLRDAERDRDAAMRSGATDLEALQRRVEELETQRDAEVRRRLEMAARADQSRSELESRLFALDRELRDARQELRRREQEIEIARQKLERTTQARRRARLVRLWDPQAHWSERASAEASVFGESAKHVTAMLAVCAVDAAIRRVARPLYKEETFHDLLDRIEHLTTADRRFMKTVWVMRGRLVHEGKWPESGFNFERLWRLADELGAVPIGAMHSRSDEKA